MLDPGCAGRRFFVPFGDQEMSDDDSRLVRRTIETVEEFYAGPGEEVADAAAEAADAAAEVADAAQEAADEPDADDDAQDRADAAADVADAADAAADACPEGEEEEAEDD